MNDIMSVARATTIACANAATRYLQLGLFMSELNSFDEQNLRFSKFIGHQRFGLSGRTNTGNSVLIHVTLIYKENRSEGFPFERALVNVNDITGSPTGPSTYLECVIKGDDFKFREVDISIFKEDGRLPIWSTDKSPDAWSLRYQHQ